MKAIEQIKRLQKIDKLIRNQCTGTPEEFSCKLSISKRQLYLELEYLKILGVNITYSRQCQTFLYKGKCRLKVQFSLEILTDENIQTIQGGTINTLQCNFYARKEATFTPVNENKVFSFF